MSHEAADDREALMPGPSHKLDTLADHFDRMLAAMQSDEARAAMRRAFDASPEKMGKAAQVVALAPASTNRR